MLTSLTETGGGTIIKTQILKKEGFYEKTISLLLVSFLLITNVFVGGFAGINAGPSFDIYTLKYEGMSERRDTFMDSGVAFDLYSTFFFGEKENIGLGIKLGADANISSMYDGHDVSNDLAETDFTLRL